MSFSTLRPKIQTKLQGISNIQKVLNYPALPKNVGMPLATIIPSEAESDYETTTENKRMYGFTIRLFYEVKKGGIAVAVSALEGLVDEVVDVFDKDERLSGIIMPAGYELIQVVPNPSAWNYDFINEGFLIADILLKAFISFDVTS